MDFFVLEVKTFTEIFNVEGDGYDNDCIILKQSSDQRNTLVLHDSESSESVSESSDSSKGYVKIL